MGGVFRQSGHRLRFDWGAEGLAALADECAVLVIVDVLSFCTATVVAVERGAAVLPLRPADEDGVAAARARGAVLAGDREWTLRPSSLTGIEPGVLLALPSPNGATLCAAAAATGARVLVAALRTATATARHAAAIGGPVGVIAAGERWGVRAGPLRPAVEDQLGAGAVLAALDRLAPGGLSPEAAVAVAAFTAVRARVAELLADCASGRELTAAGHAGDVALAGALDAADVAVELRDGVAAGVA